MGLRLWGGEYDTYSCFLLYTKYTLEKRATASKAWILDWITLSYELVEEIRNHSKCLHQNFYLSWHDLFNPVMHPTNSQQWKQGEKFLILLFSDVKCIDSFCINFVSLRDVYLLYKHEVDVGINLVPLKTSSL